VPSGTIAMIEQQASHPLTDRAQTDDGDLCFFHERETNAEREFVIADLSLSLVTSQRPTRLR
jgi:hypothetical protein